MTQSRDNKKVTNFKQISTMNILHLDADRKFGRELNFRPSRTASNKRETKTTFQRLLYNRTCPAEGTNRSD